MTPDRRDIELLSLAGKYRWLPFDKLPELGFDDLVGVAETLAKLGYIGISRSKRYMKPMPKGYSMLNELGYIFDTATNRAYDGSPVLRRRLEVSEIMLTALRAGIDVLRDDVDALQNQPVFLPVFAFRSDGFNMMNNASCSGYAHFGNKAYMLHYVCPESKGMFLTNELRIFHNLSSVFSAQLKEPKAMIFAGGCYKSVYDQITAQTRSPRHGARGYTDFNDVYKRVELPVHLLSCDEVGAMQLALMRQPDYNARLARAAFGDHWTPYDDRFPEADGCISGRRPLVIAADMDIRRAGRVIADAKRFGVKEVLIAAFRCQLTDLLMEVFPKDGMTTHLCIEQAVLDLAFGKDFSLYSMGGEHNA